jgi:hypothetical protein
MTHLVTVLAAFVYTTSALAAQKISAHRAMLNKRAKLTDRRADHFPVDRVRALPIKCASRFAIGSIKSVKPCVLVNMAHWYHCIAHLT